MCAHIHEYAMRTVGAISSKIMQFSSSGVYSICENQAGVCHYCSRNHALCN